ncbi:MAG TPA: DUF4956 domain-containing protein [Pyrinomonadaceae bacterium]|nr:DUF4956 domain-containing protein [Pyrinomonadaceae bacterium]
MLKLNPKNRKETITLIVVFLGVLLVSAFSVYFLASKSAEQRRESAALGGSPTETTPVDPRTTPRETPRTSDPSSVFGSIFSTPDQTTSSGRALTWAETLATLSLRLILAGLLGAVLAYRPRRRVLGLKPNPYVAQTQILLAVVASALMIIVGDNAARAFGIFAAVSVVRFRTNIRDPKEITVLLISLAIGLGTGVGRWDLALILTIFSVLLLWVLEYREREQVFRSMDLKVQSRNVAQTQNALREVLQSHGFDSELRAVSQNGHEEHSVGTIAYSVDISPQVSTDQISEELLERDRSNVESIEWDQKKSFSYLYQ